jgi:hypothetical protein
MRYLHYSFYLRLENSIQITLDKQAYVRLMNTMNYQYYRIGKQYKYYGGIAKISPLNMGVPYEGFWHLAIDLGGYSGTVHATVRVL